MDTESALLALEKGSPEECLAAIRLGRDSHLADEALWGAILDYFAERAPEAHFGWVASWFCLTLNVPERGLSGMRRLFTSVAPCARNIRFLDGLENCLAESRHATVRRWFALQGDLLEELVRGWLDQDPVVDRYDCSHNLVMAWARVFLPLLLDKVGLARACWEALSLHQLPPAAGCLWGLPPGMGQHCPADQMPRLIALLEAGLSQLDTGDLKAFSKKNAAHPDNHPGLRLAFHALETLVLHPDWKPMRPQVDPELLRQVIGLWRPDPQGDLEQLFPK
ncbi:MAG: hypothetical protein AB7S38_39255 [Vulcanimicrobiota bacterium]